MSPAPQASLPEAAMALGQLVFRPYESQILATAVRFELAERLSAGPRTSADLAADLGAHAETFERFLLACGTIGLVERDAGGGFALTALGGMLREGSSFLRSMALMNMSEGMWTRMGRLHETVLTGRSVKVEGEDLYEYYGHSSGERAWFASAMADLSVDAGRSLAEHYDFASSTEIVDVGGSLGILLSHVLAAAPHASGTVFDRPEVVEHGRQVVSERHAADKIGDRLSFVGGDFFSDAPPKGDLYLIKQVLCDWSDEDAARILASVHRGAPAGSRLSIIEWVRPSGPDPDPLDLMGICLQVVTGGRVRTESEFAALIEDAGFRFESTVTVPSASQPRPWSVLQAVRP